jgi:hypothetical protein
MGKKYTKYAVISGMALFSLLSHAEAQVAPIQAQVVAACGTPQTPYSAGQTRPATQDTTGTLCTVSGGGGGGSVTISAPLGNQAKSAAVAVTPATSSSLAPAVVALSTTAGQVLATGTGFVSRVVCNDDAAIVEYFGPNTVTNAGANGIKLAPGQCWDFSHNTAAIFGVSASATPNARVVQY